MSVDGKSKLRHEASQLMGDGMPLRNAVNKSKTHGLDHLNTFNIKVLYEWIDWHVA